VTESPVKAYIGLGSNLSGELVSPRAQVELALQELAQLPDSRLLAQSPLFSSKAVGPVQPDYVNAVACIETRLAPLALLDQLQALEQAHRRVRLEHWGPRTLDLDLLLYGDQQIDLPRLKVPHPYLTQRNFVLYPLAAIAPDLVLPCGTSLTRLCELCPRGDLLVLANA
jgi:2-amino-4-hydroxy-6-hydroxymethyldihydropteridine diphosphokinase